MPELASLDALALFAELTAAGVDWVLVGGLAVAIHGGSSVTDDLDLTLAVNPARPVNLPVPNESRVTTGQSEYHHQHVRHPDGSGRHRSPIL